MASLLTCGSRGAARRVPKAKWLAHCAATTQGAGDGLPDSQMSSGVVEVVDVLPEGAVQTAPTQDQDVDQALSAQAAQEAQIDGVCFWRSVRSARQLDSSALDSKTQPKHKPQ